MANTSMSVAEQIKVQREQLEQQQKQLQQSWVNEVAKEEDPDVRAQKMTHEFEMVFGRKAAGNDMDWLQKAVADERTAHHSKALGNQTMKFFVPEDTQRVNINSSFNEKGHQGSSVEVQALSKNTKLGNFSTSVTADIDGKLNPTSVRVQERWVGNNHETKHFNFVPIGSVGGGVDVNTGKLAGNAMAGLVTQLKSTGTNTVTGLSGDTNGNVNAFGVLNHQINENLDVYATGSGNLTNGGASAGVGANYWHHIDNKWKLGAGIQYTRTMPDSGQGDNIATLNFMLEHKDAAPVLNVAKNDNFEAPPSIVDVPVQNGLQNNNHIQSVQTDAKQTPQAPVDQPPVKSTTFHQPYSLARQRYEDKPDGQKEAYLAKLTQITERVLEHKLGTQVNTEWARAITEDQLGLKQLDEHLYFKPDFDVDLNHEKARVVADNSQSNELSV